MFCVKDYLKLTTHVTDGHEAFIYYKSGIVFMLDKFRACIYNYIITFMIIPCFSLLNVYKYLFQIVCFLIKMKIIK